MPKQLHIVVKYRTPSLNVTKRQHWAVQQKEKKRAWSALASALLAIVCDPSTQIILPLAAKIFSTAYVIAPSSKATSLGGSSAKRSKSKSAGLRTNAPR